MTVTKQAAKIGSVALLTGGLLGAGTALLFAPTSGRQMRQKIGNVAEDLTEKVQHIAHEGKEKAASAVDKSKHFYEGRRKALSSAVEAGKEAYYKQKERLTERLHM